MSKFFNPRSRALAPALLAALMISACGGGGGGGGGGETAANTTDATASAAVSADRPTLTAVVADNMVWESARAQGLSVQVLDANGAAATNTMVTLWTFNGTSPHNSAEALEAPNPVALIDSNATDAAGLANVGTQVPQHLTKLLVTATRYDGTTASTVVDFAHGSTATLTVN